ncbi:MAG TPA: NUDIX domain-containing protein [Candidatus Saccharimonadales bacterium]|nr:NUDIX domain-containing protein [Candidatus Saccharimonadales bacterium]
MNEENLEHIGVVVVITHPQTNKILLGKRKNAYMAGHYGLPGGRVEIEETTETSAIREVLEETNLKVSNLEYIGVVRELQDTYNFIHFGMETSSFSGELQNAEPEKCEGWEWFAVDELPEDILPGHKVVLDMFLHHIKKGMVDVGHEQSL